MRPYWRMATASSSSLAPSVSRRQPSFASLCYSCTGDRHHKTLKTVYALLEDRLPVAPLCPNDALDALFHLVPANTYHSGVVDHLVRIISGNASCMDPLLCLAVMERMLVPGLPCWLAGRSVATENVSHGNDSPAAEICDAALMMTLAPLGRVMSRCVVVHMRLRLGEKGHVTDSLCSLDGWHTTRAGPLSQRSHGSGAGDDCNSSSLLRGASVMMSFTAQQWHWDCTDSEHSAVVGSSVTHHHNRESRERWHACCLIALVYPVVRYLYFAQSQANGCERLATRADARPYCPAAAAPLQPLRWETVRSLGQRCWWWSTVVCRATPTIPSIAIRAFAANSLVDVVFKLHGALVPYAAPCESPWMRRCSKRPPPLPPPETLWPCLGMLEWLLDSVPVLRDESDADAPWHSLADPKGNAPAVRPTAWTAELRRGLWLLGEDFARLSAAALEFMAGSPGAAPDVGGDRTAAGTAYGESKSAAPPLRPRPTNACTGSRIVRAMADVGYRLALQWAAAATPLATAAAVLKLAEGTLDEQLRCSSLTQDGALECQQQERRWMPPTCELKVILRLLRAVASLRPVLPSSALTIAPGSSGAAKAIFVEESTWCKLACLVNLVRCCSVDGARNSDHHIEAVLEGVAAEDRRLHCVQRIPSAVDAMYENQAFVRLHEQQLLHCGLIHAMACTAVSAPGVVPCKVVGAVMTKNRGAHGYAGAAPQSSARAPPAWPDPSAEFLCTLLKCWRTWTMDWPLPLHAAWMQELASAAGAERTPARTGEERADQEDSSDGAALETAATVVPCFALSEIDDGNCDRVCRSIQRLLCSRLTEAWAATTDMRHDRDPLDLCAFWYAFSAVSRPPRCASATEVPLTAEGSAPPSTRFAYPQLSRKQPRMHQSSWEDELREQLTDMAAAAERCFCSMCEEWLKRLHDLSGTHVEMTGMKLAEQRPVLLQRTSLSRRERSWLPVCLPAILSHIALRVLCRSRPEGSAAPALPTLHGDSVAAERPRIDERFLALTRSAMLTPAAEELAAFQLSIVSRYVEWCEAAGVHTHWCACTVQTYRPAGGADGSHVSCISVDELVGSRSSATRMPWWVLTVDGLAVRGSKQGSVDVATILFLWEHGADAAATVAAGAKPPRFVDPQHDRRSGRASAIQPLMPQRLCRAGGIGVADTSAASPNEMDWGTLVAPREAAAEVNRGDGYCDDSDHDQWILRWSILEWSHRYALRLVLLEVVEGQWQRESRAALASQSRQQLAGLALCDIQRRRVRRLVPLSEELVEEGAKTANGAHAVDYATSAYRTAVSGPGITPRFVWHSDAYQPLLRLVAEKATLASDRLAAEVLAVACAMVAPGQASYAKAQLNDPKTAGHHATNAIVMSLVKARRPEQWTARLTAHLWGELRRGLAEGAVARPSRPLSYADRTSLYGGGPSWSPAAPHSLCQQPQSCGLACSDAVWRLEELLLDLGLVSASKEHHACRTSCGSLSREEAADESHALLASLLLSPELLCTSPNVVHFANAVLWRRCWAALVKTSSAAAHQSGRGTLGDREGPDSVAARLDALVSFRVILRCMEQLQRLVQDLAKYLCCVFVPAVQVDHCAAQLTATPVEAMRRLACTSSSASRGPASATARPDYTATAKPNRLEGRNPTEKACLSSAAVRTFEVLCLGRCGDELRAPCVWQQWTRELTREDRVLREHAFVRSMSQ
ncbi:hypothetical protein LSCM1_04102 [Leishmania martiniquensis]|uniref:Uncharacterized protein n=1 Tax=Leishmania martiniquensis TaxID=1580590 RepID=A0A836GM97_9TRYP|nr:hypothetical protein LSCM1_04102 [Leishmania martiniquensis]